MSCGLACVCTRARRVRGSRGRRRGQAAARHQPPGCLTCSTANCSVVMQVPELCARSVSAADEHCMRRARARACVCMYVCFVGQDRANGWRWHHSQGAIGLCCLCPPGLKVVRVRVGAMQQQHVQGGHGPVPMRASAPFPSQVQGVVCSGCLQLARRVLYVGIQYLYYLYIIYDLSYIIYAMAHACMQSAVPCSPC